MDGQITERDRLHLRDKLIETIGERNAEVLMEALPPMRYDELATKQDVLSVRRDLGQEIAAVRRDLGQEIGAVRRDLGQEIRAARADLQGQVDGIRAELRATRETLEARIEASEATLRGEMAAMKGELSREMAANLRMTVAANVGSMMGLAALIVGLG